MYLRTSLIHVTTHLDTQGVFATFYVDILSEADGWIFDNAGLGAAGGQSNIVLGLVSVLPAASHSGLSLFRC